MPNDFILNNKIINNMSDVITALSEKRYNDFRKTIISDSINIVLNTIANQTVITNKDKSYTVKKLTKTVELMLKLLGEVDNEQIPSDIIKTIKPRISTSLNNTFCYKQPGKVTNTNAISPIAFSPYINSTIEISYKEIKNATIKLNKSFEYYHFFTFPVTINDKTYQIVYAEENMYSKREIVEVLLNNQIVDANVIDSAIRKEYNFME